MRNILARLEKLEAVKTAAGLPVIVFTSRDGSEMWARISSPNGEATPLAVAVRAELEAEGYVVDPGYGEASRPGNSGSPAASGEVWRVHHEIVDPLPENLREE